MPKHKVKQKEEVVDQTKFHCPECGETPSYFGETYTGNVGHVIESLAPYDNGHMLVSLHYAEHWDDVVQGGQVPTFYCSNEHSWPAPKEIVITFE
ncbi:MAG TPA: hypothetical protein VJ742_12985 [Nitrososphaera sp.]|nr:hypothetical protein [Nitrososphaera sp.]